MDWYRLVFEMIDARSFSNLWYWIGLAVIWSSASHWVLGVPFDMINRARRMGAGAQDDLEVLVRINTQRMLTIARTSGIWLVAFLCFLVTMLVLMGFVYDIEFAQAVLLMLVPMAILGALSLRTAGKIEAGEGQGDALARRLGRHRLATQVLGMIAIFITSLFGMWQNLQYHMPG